MNQIISLPAPALQIGFAQALQAVRQTHLQDALLATVATLPIRSLDAQLAHFAPADDLSSLASMGLRGELLFAVPLVLEAQPHLLGYYRLLMGYSQKEFYGQGRGTSRFKSMEIQGKLGSAATAPLPDLCTALCETASILLDGIRQLAPSRALLDDLTLLTLGPQLRGGMNNRLGSNGIEQVFDVIREIVAHATTDIGLGTIRIKSATGRDCTIEFASDPDIVIREEMAAGEHRNILAIEIKSGTDASNIHNRIGEAEKSHQKARGQGFTECWTVINVATLDRKKADEESPSTDRFYSLAALQTRCGGEYEDFRRRIVSLTAIAFPTT